MAGSRPWWGNPWLWVGVSALFALLGWFVWPALLGGAFVFLPLIWIGRGRGGDMDPRSNGHGRSEDARRL